MPEKRKTKGKPTPKANKPSGKPKGQEPTGSYRPIKSRIRSNPTTGPSRAVRVRFPRAILSRVMDRSAKGLGGPWGEFVRATFEGRKPTSPMAVPPAPLIGRTIHLPTEVAEAIVGWEKEHENDLDQLVYAALVAKLGL